MIQIKKKTGDLFPGVVKLFLARLHFSAEELLLYRRRPHAKCYGKC